MTNKIFYDSGVQANKCYISDTQYFGFHFATFDNLSQLKAFIKRFGGTLKIKDKHTGKDGNALYTLDSGLEFINAKRCFCKKSDLPKGAKPIKALSNGSIVKCYYTINNDVVTFYRPNPNAKKVYKPLNLKEHIAYRKENGIF